MNVYNVGIGKIKFYSVKDAEDWANMKYTKKVIYRIHVKMKEPKLVSGSEMIKHRTIGFKISYDWKVI